MARERNTQRDKELEKLKAETKVDTHDGYIPSNSNITPPIFFYIKAHD